MIVVDDHLLLDVLGPYREQTSRDSSRARSTPLSIAVVEARTAVPVMVGVTGATRSNLLTAEAVATGLILDADIAVGVESSLLREAAEIAHLVAHYVRQ